MNDQELRELIAHLLESAWQASGEPVTGAPGANPDDGLELTSLELVRLLVTLEEHLDIELDDVAVMNARLDTVDDIIALVRESQPLSSTGAAVPYRRVE
jgi:acyl carrier protein